MDHDFTKMLLLLTLALITFNSAQSILVPASHLLYSALHHFETLHKVNDIHHRVVRDNMPHPRDNLRQIQFRTLGRHFQLLLSPHTRPFHPHVAAHYTGHTHSRRPINVYQFFHGHVLGTESSHVIAHVTGDGVITAVITIGDNSYYLEPSDRHFSESHDFHMITYRGSDLKFNMTGEPNGQFCGVIGSHDHHDNPYDVTGHAHFEMINLAGQASTLRGRLKRQSSLPNASKVCPVNIVATTSFYKQFGGSNEENTINYILMVMLQIDAIFRGVDWSIPGVSDSTSIGVRGFQLANVTVLTSTSEDSPEYNDDRSWLSTDLVNEFGRTDWTDYCLAHLFTARRFSDSSRLGVAYTAFHNSFKAGGICSVRDDCRGIPTQFNDCNGRPLYRNVGVSTYRARKRFLVLAEAVIVTGHEFGHGWGGRHDDSMAECSPSNSKGGKYIMNTYAQNGDAPNNKRFSNCSRRAISKVLSYGPRDRCFVEPTNNPCGDFIIDEGEECDPGPTAILRGGDLCCNADCTFKTSSNGGDRYNCSDSNHDCCSQCRPSPVGEVCHQEEEGNINCYGNRTCNGSITCPNEVVFVDEGATCGILGECRVSNESLLETVCVNFCEQMDLVTCYCSGENECHLCCKMSPNSSCEPFDDNPFIVDRFTFLPDGSFCEGGTCNDQGVCELIDPDLSSFFAYLITNSAFARLFRENIVGGVLVISIVFWIPVTLAVHLIENYRDKVKEENEMEKKQDKKRKRDKRRKEEDRTPLISKNGEVDQADHPLDEQSPLRSAVEGRGSVEPTDSSHLLGETAFQTDSSPERK